LKELSFEGKFNGIANGCVSFEHAHEYKSAACNVKGIKDLIA